jgi:hypothetical protein
MRFLLWLGMVANTCNPSYVGAYIGGSLSEASPMQKLRDPLSENKLKQKGLGDMAQVVEHLPSKHRP